MRHRSRCLVLAVSWCSGSQVLATNGNTQLGGDDFDRRIMSWLLENFEKETGLDLRSAARQNSEGRKHPRCGLKRVAGACGLNLGQGQTGIAAPCRS